MIAVCVVVGAGIGWGSTKLDDGAARPGRTYYKATTTLSLDNLSTQSGGLQPSVSNLDQIAILTTTGDVPDRVASTLSTPEPGRQLAEKVVTTTNSLTSTLDIGVVDPSPGRAVTLADAFAKALVASLRQRDQDRYNAATTQDQSELASLQDQANQLLARLRANPPDADIVQGQYDATRNAYYSKYSELQALTTSGPAKTTLSVLVPAEAGPISANLYNTIRDMGALGQNHLQIRPGDESTGLSSSSTSLSSPLSRTLVGGLLGLLIGIAIALFIDRLDGRIRTRDDAEEAFGLPVLAEVPRLTREDAADDQLISFSAPLSRAAEAFRAVRTSLSFQQKVGVPATVASNGQHPNGSASLFEPLDGETLVIMVTSAAPREGKSTTTANLAVAFAEADASVLVVNCDFRRPAIHRRFGLTDEPRRVQDTAVPGVKIVTNVLPEARANPSQVVTAQRQVVGAARGRFDVILLDTAPLLTANDAIDVIGSVDLVLLVAQSGLSTRANARRVVNLLSRVDAQMAGVALLAAQDVSNDYYYYYQQRGAHAEGPPRMTSRDADDIFSSVAIDDPTKR